jgi:NADPH2:quinone reductase
MRSVVVTRTGGPEVLELQEHPDPEPGAGQVVVDVEAAGVNFIDVYQREGRYPLQVPFTAGSEGAGVVRAVGEGVADVAAGDRVAWAMVNGSGYTSVPPSRPTGSSPSPRA